MRHPAEEIWLYVRSIVEHPDAVKVFRISHSPITYEITAHRNDLPDLIKKETAIRAILRGHPRFVLKYIEAM